MTQLAEKAEGFMSNLMKFGVRDGGNALLEDLRKRGIARFKETGFPTAKQEEWKFTNVAPIAKTAFRPGAYDESAEQEVARYSLGKQAAAEVVFINGRFSPKLSKLSRLPAGVTVLNLADADSELLERHLGRYATIESNPFVAMNAGFVGDGAVIHFARGTRLAQPVHVIFLSAGGREATVSHPRVLLIAEDGTEATVVESYVGERGSYFTNAVTEVFAGQHARIDHCRLGQESLDAFHVSSTNVYLSANA